jgi:hypothetical protein
MDDDYALPFSSLLWMLLGLLFFFLAASLCSLGVECFGSLSFSAFSVLYLLRDLSVCSEFVARSSCLPFSDEETGMMQTGKFDYLMFYIMTFKLFKLSHTFANVELMWCKPHYSPPVELQAEEPQLFSHDFYVSILHQSIWFPSISEIYE